MMINSIIRTGFLARIAAALVVAVIAATSIAAPATAESSGDKTYRIGFSLWKPGKIYDEAMAGIRDGLQLEGIRYEEVILEAGKDKELAAENLRQLDAMGLDVIYSLSSAGTKIAKKLNLKTPVIATVINHPASLGVGPDGASDGGILTGTSYYIDAKKQLELYRSLYPEAKTVGMIFDANNPAGSLAEMPFMAQACEKAGLEFVSIGINDKSELQSSAQRLVTAGVDMIVVPTNRLVYGNLDIVLEETNKVSIPVVSMNKQGVENGAIAALYADTYNLGRQTAAMVRQIVDFDGNLLQIPFAFVSEPDVILNLAAASGLGFDFPAEVLSSAAIIMQ